MPWALRLSVCQRLASRVQKVTEALRSDAPSGASSFPFRVPEGLDVQVGECQFTATAVIGRRKPDRPHPVCRSPL